jgi:uncharacterized protein YjdB
MKKNFTSILLAIGLTVTAIQVHAMPVFNNTIPHTGMTITTTSEQNSSAEVALAGYAIDDNPNTFWHTQWHPTQVSLPQSVTINLGALYNIAALRYLPRQDGNDHGYIGRYIIYISTDGTNFNQVASGTWNYDITEKTVAFPAVDARYIRLEALEGIINVASAAEINIEQWTPPVPVTGIHIDPATATISGYGTLQLTATVSPSNASNKKVIWTSGNTAVAAVSNTGLVGASNVGPVTITATTEDGGFMATSQITVSAIPVSGVSIDPGSATLTMNATRQLRAAIAPANATNKEVQWTSGNPSIATVSSHGLVKAVSPGTVTITATSPDGNKTAGCTMVITAAGNGTTAIRAVDFLNSVGVAAHMSQGIDNPTQVANCMTFCGMRNVRDDGTSNSSLVQNWIDMHANAGIKFCPLSGGDISNAISVMYEPLAAAGALLAVEGPNEPNNFRVTYQGIASDYNTTFLPVAKYQRDLYIAIRNNPNLTGIPVFHSSEAGGSEPDNVGLQFLTIPANAGTIMPAGTQYADFANTHNYVCGHQNRYIDNYAWNATSPTLNDDWDGLYVEYGHTWHNGFSGYSNNDLVTLPRVSTETGWPTSGTGAISEDQQGKVLTNVYLSGFKQGWSYTFPYMLRDDPNQGYWGFFNTDYSPKISATYLHNLTTVLADNGAISAPGQINYSIANQPSTVHDLLLQKSNGTYELVVWGEQVSGSNQVTVQLGADYDTVKVYDITTGTAPVQTYSTVNAVTIPVNDHAMIIEFNSGVYIVRFIEKNFSTSQKIVLQ